MRCRRCRTQAGHPFPGTQLPLTQPDSPVRGPVLPALKPGGGSRTSPGGRAPGAAAHIAGSGVPSAGPFQVGLSLGRRFVPPGLPQSLVLEVPAGMLVPAKVFGQYPGHTGPGKVRRHMISDRPSQVQVLVEIVRRARYNLSHT
jgi:hypothetical protein